MAGLEIKVERRPCYYKNKRAFFHTWAQVSQIISPSNLRGGHNGGVVATVLAIIETEDGSVRKVYPEEITFADGGNFENYAFLPMEEKTND